MSSKSSELKHMRSRRKNAIISGKNANCTQWEGYLGPYRHFGLYLISGWADIRYSPLAHLGKSDHVSLFLIPAYVSIRKTGLPTIKTIRAWPNGGSRQLQDCFDRTNWDVFEHQDLEMFTDSVMCCIGNCIYTVTVEKQIWVYPSQKPWITRVVQQLLRERNTAFRSGDRALYSMA